MHQILITAAKKFVFLHVQLPVPSLDFTNVIEASGSHSVRENSQLAGVFMLLSRVLQLLLSTI